MHYTNLGLIQSDKCVCFGVLPNQGIRKDNQHWIDGEKKIVADPKDGCRAVGIRYTQRWWEKKR